MTQDINAPRKFAAVAAQLRETIEDINGKPLKWHEKWEDDQERLALSFATAEDARKESIVYIQRPVVMNSPYTAGVKAAGPQVFSPKNGWYNLGDRQESARLKNDVSRALNSLRP